MKYVSIRKPEVGPLGDTLFDASVFAIVEAFFVNSPSGGRVESVLTLATHSLSFSRVLAVLAVPSFRLRSAILRLMFAVPLKPLARLYRESELMSRF